MGRSIIFTNPTKLWISHHGAPVSDAAACLDPRLGSAAPSRGAVVGLSHSTAIRQGTGGRLIRVG